MLPRYDARNFNLEWMRRWKSIMEKLRRWWWNSVILWSKARKRKSLRWKSKFRLTSSTSVSHDSRNSFHLILAAGFIKKIQKHPSKNKQGNFLVTAKSTELLPKRFRPSANMQREKVEFFSISGNIEAEIRI